MRVCILTRRRSGRRDFWKWMLQRLQRLILETWYLGLVAGELRLFRWIVQHLTRVSVYARGRILVTRVFGSLR